MAEPISAAALIAAGTAVVTGVGVVVSAAGVAHKMWEAHKKDPDKKSDQSMQPSQQPVQLSPPPSQNCKLTVCGSSMPARAKHYPESVMQVGVGKQE